MSAPPAECAENPSTTITSAARTLRLLSCRGQNQARSPLNRRPEGSSVLPAAAPRGKACLRNGLADSATCAPPAQRAENPCTSNPSAARTVRLLSCRSQNQGRITASSLFRGLCGGLQLPASGAGFRPRSGPNSPQVAPRGSNPCAARENRAAFYLALHAGPSSKTSFHDAEGTPKRSTANSKARSQDSRK